MTNNEGRAHLQGFIQFVLSDDRKCFFVLQSEIYRQCSVEPVVGDVTMETNMTFDCSTLD